MPDTNKTEEFLQKLAPCIERGDLDACVEETARVAGEMGVGAGELLGLSTSKGMEGMYDFAYVLALAAIHGLEGKGKAGAYNNAGLAAQYLRKVEKAEEHYKQAIEADPKLAAAHSNYAKLLKEEKRNDEAEHHYKLAIEADPKYAATHSNYANLLSGQKRNDEAEQHYKLAIEADPNLIEAHGAYGLYLIDNDKRDKAWEETKIASDLFKKTLRITESHLVKAWFYERYSEKNFLRKQFRGSGEDAEKAGDEYLNASETTEGVLKDDLALQGNVLKAKSFVRKIPEKSRYRKILNRFGKNPNISELMDNLGEAAKYYEKASCCSAGERKDICNACFSSIRVFSEILHSMNALVQNDDAEIDKDKWLSSLEMAHKIYADRKLNNGAALVDTLKQLIKCVDELAEHRKIGLHIQEENLGKCYNNLLEVSEKLEGALKIIAEHSIEAIRDYAKKQGMGFIGGETKISLWGKLVEKIYDNVTTLIIAAFVYILYLLNIIPKLTDQIKSLIGSP